MKIKNVVAALFFLATAFHTLGQTAPLVTVTMPTNGATYFAPANIYLRAEASDTNGIAATQILVGTNWIGSAKSNVFLTVWTNPPVGTYTIVGNALNNLNVWGTSAPVTISVISNPLPAVSITATDSHATEGGDDLGQFTISRTGAATNDLTVLYTITGTASNGIDIVTLPTSVTIPAGSTNATLTVQPIDDTLVEITESVILTLKTNSAYRLGSPTSATVYVYDNDVNHPPVVQVTNPHDGNSFTDPVTLSLTADASDIDGSLASVSFFRNGILIAYGTKNPTNNTYSATWTNVPAGNFAITALARDGINTSLAVTSAPVSIAVTRTNPAPYVVVTAPTDGKGFTNVGSISLSAYAVTGDAAHSVKKVEFFVDSTLVNTFSNSTSSSFSLQWTNPPLGSHVFIARATDDGDTSNDSAPVNFLIASNQVLTVTATDATASEPGTDTGSFTISRTGIGDALVVNYKLTGTASNGVDYSFLSGSVTIPAGSSSAVVLVQPIDDTLIEGTETVTLTMSSSNIPTGVVLGSPSSATVNILDNETNHPPVVQVTNPHDGDSFADPLTISLTADASDVDGALASVSFFRNGILIAYGTKNPSNNTYSTTWTNVPAGNFAITALARDAISTSLAVTSAPVNITVTRTNPAPYVVVTAPTDGKGFTNVGSISLAAYASIGDAAHPIKKVEFFVDSGLFATFTNSTSSSFSLQWTNPPLGAHVFIARATDDAGTSNDSSPVSFLIVSNQVVTVTATDAIASEPGTDTGSFKISRTGYVGDPLVVNYKLTGTASNGVDYSFLPGSVTIPAGSSNAVIVVQPIDDTLIEGTETAILTLLSANNPPGVTLGSAISATVSIYDNDTNQAPTVVILNPTNNSSFTLPTNILLQAEAHDDGTVTGVAFWRGTNWIGTAYASSNNTSPIFSFLWTNAPTGDFSITARAYDNLQAAATSAPVHVVISAPISNAVPTVSIYYPTNGSKFTSPTNVELTAIASESNGMIATVQFFANGSSVGTATNNPASAQPGNVFHITWANPSPGSYTLTAKATDTNGVATTSAPINVTVVSPNIPPTVYIDSPANNSLFYGPTNITITAQASDADGQVARVYFFNGTQVLGRATNAPYTVVWSNVTAGSYSIVAKAFDNQEGSGYSTPVAITVRSWSEISFVTRSLPIWYVPGVKLSVKLQASPKTNTTSYVVQDTPPAGWTINSVGENGSIDTGGLGVTFGPFNDKLARTFTYTVTPPVTDSGEKHFVGTGTANGVTSPILGVSAITSAQPHPADLNPTNYFISTNELDAYTLGWKQCAKWPVSPSPIPVNYLTRAGYIARGSGSYSISTNYPSPQAPLIWVRDSATPDNTTNTLVGNVPWTTNSYGSAVATMPTNYFSNVTFTVSISVTPATPCSAYAVEDRPPEGWIVSNVSDGGFYCPILKKVKWGLFLDNQARTLTYQITPATNLSTTVGFSGVASFDGINVPITGRRYAYFSAGTPPAAKLQSIITSPSGDRIITFLGQPGIVYRLDGSDNLIDWTRIDQMLNADGVLYYTDPSTNALNHFYRAIPADGN